MARTMNTGTYEALQATGLDDAQAKLIATAIPDLEPLRREMDQRFGHVRVWYLHRQGRSTRYIAAELNVPRRTVRRFILGVAEAH